VLAEADDDPVLAGALDDDQVGDAADGDQVAGKALLVALESFIFYS